MKTTKTFQHRGATRQSTRNYTHVVVASWRKGHPDDPSASQFNYEDRVISWHLTADNADKAASQAERRGYDAVRVEVIGGGIVEPWR